MPRRDKLRRRLFRSLPPIDLRARIRGHVNFLCPYCYRFTLVTHLIPKKSRLRCRRVGCRKSVAFGIYGHLGGPFSAPEPFKALFCDQKHLFQLNRLTLRPDDVAVPAIGKIGGKVDFQCPTCRQWVTDDPSFVDGKLVCPKCRAPFWISLLLWSIPMSVKRFMPHDWIPPSPSERLPVEGAGASSGSDCDGAGAAGPAPLWS